MRPTYESEEDRKQERQIADLLSVYWRCRFAKLKKACHVDFGLIREDKIVGLVEIKCRNYSLEEIDKMGGLFISALKYQAARQWCDTYKIGFAVIAKLSDGLYFWSTKKDEPFPVLKMEMGGRTDRGDWQDIEPCCLVPANEFRKLEI